MRYLLAAINAKYIHSNLGIYSLRRYAMERLGLGQKDEQGAAVGMEMVSEAAEGANRTKTVSEIQIDLGEYTIAALDNFMSINNAVDLDLFGQVNAESAGIKHISGAGGQLDFVLGAYLSKGGKSFICCSSTFKNKAGELQSRILPTLNQGSIVTDTRANLHYLVTEYGKVNLKGLATWQKCEAIISVAHPQFRDQLIKEAEKMHIWRQSNKI